MNAARNMRPVKAENIFEHGGTWSLDVYKCFPRTYPTHEPQRGPSEWKSGHWFASVAIAGALTVGEKFATRDAAEAWGRATLADRLAMTATAIRSERDAWLATHEPKAVA